MMRLSTALARMLTVGALFAVAGPAAAQQPYPSKPIRFITPYAPGGATTVLARMFGQKLTESWGQQVLVDNRPGGNTIIGTEALAKSPPDGYTILLANVAHVIIPNLLPVPFDAIKDFAPVATVSSTESILVLHPSVPAGNLREFIALAKSRPAQLNFPTAGSGGLGHLAGELFNIMAGVRMQNIPYKGNGPAVTDLIGGQVQLSFQGPVNVAPHIKSGRLKAIAITGEARLPALPHVPTFTEAGLPGFELKIWQGVLAPAGTPKAIINKMSRGMAALLAMPETKESLARQGMEPYISTTPAQVTALIRTEIARYAKIIKTANIKIE